MINKIIFATDFSKLSHQAFDYTLKVAQKT